MEGFYLILLIVLLVFGVLQIILFFKVWGMTNDVRKISIHFCGVNKPNESATSPDSELPRFGPGEIVVYKENGMKLMIVQYNGSGMYRVADLDNQNSYFIVKESELKGSICIP